MSLQFLVAVLFNGCSSVDERHSDLFNQVVRPERGGLFRGVELGMKLDDVKRIEALLPRHDDKYGFEFEFSLGDRREFILEYISKNQEVRTISSIVGNVFLRDEGETTMLYNELEKHWRGLYGVADGAIGDLRWKHAEAGLSLTLRILEDKKSLSFNFVPASGF